jgi:hypothetical protein
MAAAPAIFGAAMVSFPMGTDRYRVVPEAALGCGRNTGPVGSANKNNNMLSYGTLGVVRVVNVPPGERSATKPTPAT